MADETPPAADGERPAPAVHIQNLCPRHRHDLIVRRLRIKPNEPWLVVEVTAQILLFQRAAASPKIHARTEGDAENLSLVLAELGCLACWDRDGYNRAVLLLRKGVDHAAAVARMEREDPIWPRHWPGEDARRG